MLPMRSTRTGAPQLTLSVAAGTVTGAPAAGVTVVGLTVAVVMVAGVMAAGVMVAGVTVAGGAHGLVDRVGAPGVLGVLGVLDVLDVLGVLDAAAVDVVVPVPVPVVVVVVAVSSVAGWVSAGSSVSGASTGAPENSTRGSSASRRRCRYGAGAASAAAGRFGDDGVVAERFFFMVKRRWLGWTGEGKKGTRKEDG